MSNEELVLQIQQGKDRKENLEKLYVNNISLIRRFIKPYTNYCEADDLMQEAYFGIVKAADDMDLSQGVKFMSYAQWKILGEVSRYCARNTIKRIPESHAARIRKYRRFLEQYQLEHGKAPSREAVIEGMGITEDQYDLMIKVITETEMISLSAQIGEGFSVEDTLADDKNYEEDVLAAIMRDTIWKQVDLLPDRQAEVITLHYKDDMTLEDIGEMQGVTRERIRQIEAKACTRLSQNKQIKALADCWGYGTQRLYHDGVSKFKHTRSSQVETVAIKRVDYEQRLKRANELMKELQELSAASNKP